MSHKSVTVIASRMQQEIRKTTRLFSHKFLSIPVHFLHWIIIETDPGIIEASMVSFKRYHELTVIFFVSLLKAIRLNLQKSHDDFYPWTGA